MHVRLIHKAIPSFASLAPTRFGVNKKSSMFVLILSQIVVCMGQQSTNARDSYNFDMRERWLCRGV